MNLQKKNKLKDMYIRCLKAIRQILMSYKYRCRFLSRHDGFNDGRNNDFDDRDMYDENDNYLNNTDSQPLVRRFESYMQIFVHFPMLNHKNVQHIDLTVDYAQRVIGIHIGDIFCIFPYDLKTTVLQLLQHICDLPPFAAEDFIKFRLENANSIDVATYRKGFLALTLHDIPIKNMYGSFLAKIN